MTQIKEFNNLDYLQAVRNNHLNPLIRRVEDEVIPTLTLLENEIHDSYKNVSLNIDTKTLKFDKGPGGFKEINLTPVLPAFEGIGVQNMQSQGPSTGITLVQFPDATITQNNKTATVGFNWQEIFQHNQKYTEAVVKGSVTQMKSIVFTGDTDAVKQVGDNVTFAIPKVSPLTVISPDTAPAIPVATEVKSLKIIGNTGSTGVDAQGQLTIDLPVGGSGTFTTQNFQGFFESLGDIQSQIKDPIDGKSYAFAKDSKLGGNYYTPYFYVNGQWRELKKDPALTYEDPKAALPVGVFSVKPSDKIIVDANGQMNLDGLSTPQLPQYFEGFFDSLDALKAEVPNPTRYQSFAFVKGPGGGWLTYRADMQGSASMWKVVAPLGSFSFVDEAAGTYSQVFGIKKNPAWTVDSRGLLDMVGGGGGGNLTAQITDYEGNMTSSQFNTIQFRKSKSNVTAYNDKLFVEHPQQVISYDADFEDEHNTQDFEGNIFYDETSRTWMGWGIPAAGGAVDVKWTRIAHPKMSDEVKDLNRRVPAKAPSVIPGIIGDNARWDYNGVTFVEKDSTAIPDELKGKCGGYITTSVQDKDAPGITIPQYRIQTLTADRPEGGTFVRRFDSAGSQGGAVSWTDWVRTSFSHKDIEAHQKDPAAHKDLIKYHVVFALTGNLQSIFAQTAGNSLGGLHEDNGLMIVDNYGYTNQAKDYMDPPYTGEFRITGVLSFSGYNEKNKTYPAGRWQILFRKKRKDTQEYGSIGLFYYVHTDESKPYPSLSFLGRGIPLESNQEVVINLNFDSKTALNNKHPNLYLAPTRSYLVLEDEATTTGTLVGEAHRKLYGNLDVFGEVGIKSHHSDIANPSSAIRVYGEKLEKTPKVMTFTP
ncbi:MAG: hypothetical protein ACRC6V_17000 [Bacteroidales bacterium]